MTSLLGAMKGLPWECGAGGLCHLPDLTSLFDSASREGSEHLVQVTQPCCAQLLSVLLLAGEGTMPRGHRTSDPCTFPGQGSFPLALPLGTQGLGHTALLELVFKN